MSLAISASSKSLIFLVYSFSCCSAANDGSTNSSVRATTCFEPSSTCKASEWKPGLFYTSQVEMAFTSIFLFGAIFLPRNCAISRCCWHIRGAYHFPLFSSSLTISATPFAPACVFPLDGCRGSQLNNPCVLFLVTLHLKASLRSKSRISLATRISSSSIGIIDSFFAERAGIETDCALTVRLTNRQIRLLFQWCLPYLTVSFSVPSMKMLP